MSRWIGLFWKISTVIAGARARHRGIQLGSSVRFLGQPIITKPTTATISIGDRTVLVSSSAGTALGVRSPVILRCLTPTAIIEIGEDCGLSGAVICAAIRVQIGRRCLIGADCLIFDTDFHNHAPEGRRYSVPAWEAISAQVIVEDDVFVGARCILCKGVTIGAGSIVAAGSVVTGDIPPMCMAAGVPARVLRQICSGDSIVQ